MKVDSENMLERFVKMLNSNRICKNGQLRLKLTDRMVTDSALINGFNIPRYQLAITVLKTTSTGAEWLDVLMCNDDKECYGIILAVEGDCIEDLYDRLLNIILGKRFSYLENGYCVPKSIAKLELMLSIEGF